MSATPFPTCAALCEAGEAALRQGEAWQAAAHFLELERREPCEGRWPLRLAAAYEALDRPAQELAAALRAASRLVVTGQVELARRAMKCVRRVEPDHAFADPRLVGLLPPPPTVEEQGSDEIELTDELPPLRPTEPAFELTCLAESPFCCDDASGLPPELQPGVAREQLRRSEALLDAALRELPIFSQLGAGGRRTLVEASELLHLAEGEALFRQGAPHDALYAVLEGAVVPVLDAGDEIPVKRLGVIEAGGVLGEIALLCDSPRATGAEALVETRVLRIGRAALARVLAEEPQAQRGLLAFLRSRLLAQLVTSSAFFSTLPGPLREALAERFRFYEIAAGRALVQQGGTSQALFVLLSGEARAVHREAGEESVLAEFVPGQVFGEHSILSGEPALCAVETRSRCWALALPRSAVREWMAREPRAREAAEDLCLERRRSQEKSLRGDKQLLLI